MNQGELNDLVQKWTKRLRLQDWDVYAEIARSRDMEKMHHAGEVERQQTTRTAWIRLLDPVDLDPEYAGLNDLETTLVHECLHLYTAPLEIPERGPKHIAEEQMINAIAHALVMLSRGEEP